MIFSNVLEINCLEIVIFIFLENPTYLLFKEGAGKRVRRRGERALHGFKALSLLLHQFLVLSTVSFMF